MVTKLAVETSNGLSSDEALSRQRQFGPNLLKEPAQRSLGSIVVAQFRSILVGLLALSLIAAMAFEEWVEAAAIGAVIAINAVIGFVTELKAARSMEALRRLGRSMAVVRRDGETKRIDAAQLVPGDIVLVEGGDIVTADLRITQAASLEADESTLTGESLPCAKGASPTADETDIAERTSMLYKGTVVTRGNAEGVVVATGMASELGRIAHLVETAELETTPLERKLNKLGQGLVWITLLIALLVSLPGLLFGDDKFLVIQTAIALAVAAVPEGLPVIATIALARGMRRMAERDALVNRLSAVETLGATSVICTDKTGTLTENRMTVAAWHTNDELCRTRAIEVALLCNHATLSESGEAIGDPTETALLRAGRELGVERAALLSEAPMVHELPFDSDSKRMLTVHKQEEQYRVAVKGAPETVLAKCVLSKEESSAWESKAHELAKQGLRLLGLAEKNVYTLEDDLFCQLRWLGLVAMHDPPKAGVSETIRRCREAGIRMVMVTGDHPVTASKIATMIGLAQKDERALLGRTLDDLERLDEPARVKLVNTTVFARVNPEQKLSLIQLHQDSGAIVAMTGDGVNDAPALRKADIGVAMGKRGTEAAREAAAMVLQDDNLATIHVAIAEGRTIYENIRRFSVYLLSCNVAEVLVVAIAAGIGAPLPLLPLQILFLNLVTDVFPALALGMGASAQNVMKRPPRNPNEPILGKAQWRAIGTFGALITASVLAAFYVELEVLRVGYERAVSVSFLTVALAQLWHVFNIRSFSSPRLRNEVTTNPWVWGALGLCITIIAIATYVQPVASVLQLVPPSGLEWLVILSASAAPVVASQLFNIRPAI